MAAALPKSPARIAFSPSSNGSAKATAVAARKAAAASTSKRRIARAPDCRGSIQRKKTGTERPTLLRGEARATAERHNRPGDRAGCALNYLLVRGHGRTFCRHQIDRHFGAGARRTKVEHGSIRIQPALDSTKSLTQ